ncbi:hypothetical protein BGZ68_006178 [Mortierella alpina]|nr:hypothetical protein BGZ68_006178 [Mortierella alpina]
MKNISSQSELNRQLSSAGSRLVVVDFFATWCGPCKTLAPILDGLERKHTSTIFAKVDVDQAQDCAKQYSVSSMPTILFFKNKSEVGRVVGADVGKIQSLIKTYEGGSLATVATSAKTGLIGDSADKEIKTVEGPGGSCQIQIRMLDGSSIRGDFEPTHTLQRVRDFVQANLDARGVKAPGFTLMTNFPKTVYKDGNLQQTLEEAQLTPRAQLIVMA